MTPRCPAPNPYDAAECVDRYVTAAAHVAHPPRDVAHCFNCARGRAAREALAREGRRFDAVEVPDAADWRGELREWSRRHPELRDE